MEPYLFYGVILPERAQMSLNFELGFSHFSSGEEGEAKVSIVLNQLTVTVYTKTKWDIFDLRNVVKHIVQSHLGMIGYLKGYAYEFDVIRVLNPSLDIDYVFGIDVPCIAKPRESINLEMELNALRTKTVGENGMFIDRCLNDLVSSMKYADDTGFYCYRAIESLRLHCASVHGLKEEKKSIQWSKFREISNLSADTIYEIKTTAQEVRHGGVVGVTGEERAEILKKTWDIISAYLKHV